MVFVLNGLNSIDEFEIRNQMQGVLDKTHLAEFNSIPCIPLSINLMVGDPTFTPAAIVLAMISLTTRN